MPVPTLARLLALGAAGALASGLGRAAVQAGGEALAVDRPLELRLALAADPAAGGLACARTLALVPERDGPLTVFVDSYEADVLVQLVDEDGALLDGDDDGGVEWNARLVVDAAANERLLLRVGFKQAGAGLLTCVVREGAIEAPSGHDAVRALVRFLEGRAGAARARSDAVSAARLLDRAGNLAFDSGDYVACLRVYETAEDLLRALDAETAGQRELQLFAILTSVRLGAVSLQLDDVSRAEAKLVEGIDAARAWSPRQQGDQIECFARMHLGKLLLARGDLVEAHACYERALEIAATYGLVEDQVHACSLMAELATREGASEDEIEQWYGRALAQARRSTDARLIVGVLLEEGRSLSLRGHYARAKGALTEALDLATAPFTRNAILGQLGDVARTTGGLQEARECYEAVLDGARELGNRPQEFAARVALGGVLSQIGAWEAACLQLEQALRLRESASPVERAEALRCLAAACLETPRAEEAQGILKEALDLAREARDRRAEGMVLSTEVVRCYRDRDWARGRVLAEEQVAIGRELGLLELEAVGLANLAELQLRQGEPELAKATNRAALELHERLGSRTYLQRALLTSVEISMLEADRASVDADIARAEGCFEDLSSLSFDLASLRRSRDVYALWGEHSQDLVALAMASDLMPEELRVEVERGFERAGAWKGRALWQGIAEHRTGSRNAATIAIRNERRELLAERDAVLANLAVETRANGREERLQGLRRQARDLKERADEILARLQAEAPRDAALDAPTGVSAAGLAPVLGQTFGLVEFVEGRREVYAYTLWRGTLRFHAIGEREAVRQAVHAYVEGIARREELLSAGDLARVGGGLYRLLLAPLCDSIPDDAPLVVVPSAVVAGLPFEALVVEGSQTATSCADLTFVLDRRAVCYAASTPVLALLEDVEPRRASGPALVLADPIFGDEAAEGLLVAAATVPGSGGALGTARRGEGWARLVGTRQESLAVAASLEARATGEAFAGVLEKLEAQVGKQRSEGAEGRAFELKLGAEASPDLLRGDLRRFSILHFATHGWTDPLDPRRRGLVLSEGANGVRLLELEDILDLDLDLDLAVLSACETGRGEIRSGEGVQSLAWAFQYAGARSVVASLWQVDDVATARIMRQLYTRGGEPGETLSAALREALLVERAGGSGSGTLRGRLVEDGAVPIDHDGHPYFWASFVAFCLPDAASGLSSSR